MRGPIQLILLCVFFNCLAQGQVIVGDISDAVTGLPVSSVHVQFEGEGTQSNENGEFILMAKTTSGHLNTSHVSYEEHNQLLSQAEFADGIYRIKIYLKPRVIEIDEIEIVTRPAPEIIFKHKFKHVSDFELTGNQYVVLAYTKEKLFKSQEHVESKLVKGAMLYLSNKDHFVLDSIELGHGQFQLMSDFRKNIVLDSGPRKYIVSANENKLKLSEVDAVFYNSFLSITEDSLKMKYYYSTFQKDFPSFEYYAYNSSNKTYKKLHQTSDMLGMELLRSEYKYLDGRDKVEAMHWARLFRVDKEVVAAHMTGFSQSQYFNELYVPLEVMEDQIYIFDHNDDLIYVYDSLDQLIEKIPIDYHLEKGLYEKFKPNNQWNNELFFDEKNCRVFTSYLKNGYTWISEIDLNSGETFNSQKLYQKYIENLKIKNGQAYYIFRPFESSQKKYLFEEEIYCGLSSSSK